MVDPAPRNSILRPDFYKTYEALKFVDPVMPVRFAACRLPVLKDGQPLNHLDIFDPGMVRGSGRALGHLAMDNSLPEDVSVFLEQQAKQIADGPDTIPLSLDLFRWETGAIAQAFEASGNPQLEQIAPCLRILSIAKLLGVN